MIRVKNSIQVIQSGLLSRKFGKEQDRSPKLEPLNHDEIHLIQDAITVLQRELNRFKNEDLEERLNRIESDGDIFRDDAEQFAEDLTNRDWPMTRDDIIKALKYANYEITEKLIKLASPDSQEAKDDEAARWADAQDFGEMNRRSL